MHPLPAAFTLTIMALLVGVGIVAFEIRPRQEGGIIVRATDDMGTSGLGDAASSSPSASNSSY